VHALPSRVPRQNALRETVNERQDSDHRDTEYTEKLSASVSLW
jgi:hypothetical protein